MKILRCDQKLGDFTRNIGTLFVDHGKQFSDRPAFGERHLDGFNYTTWQTLCDDIFKLAHFLSQQAFHQHQTKSHRIAIIAGNSYQRLVCEMAVMCSGLVSVPIFAGYPKALMSDLLRFSDVDLLVSDVPLKVAELAPDSVPNHCLFLDVDECAKPDISLQFEGKHLSYFSEIMATSLSYFQKASLEQQFLSVDPHTQALIMYTSGTSGFPKGVQLTHANLMSQQKALALLWKPKPGMRFLCYLPWHHSFGGLFERFFALHSGGCLVIDDSRGKNVDRLIENFIEIKPHVYFSVPKIYQDIVSKVLADQALEQHFFHSDLQFVFTAAAPLPLSTSDVFKRKEIPVVEGWGLTETSPCCTLTGFDLNRQSGVVGFPIPGVEVALGDENELWVRGANVMSGYFKNPESTEKVLTHDGWFKTGDIGEITEQGVKIISRKERMFKLSNGEKMFPAELEDDVNNRCCYIKYSYVFGSGQTHPFMLVFPNKDLIESAKSTSQTRYGCARPRDLNALSNCLGKCVKAINAQRKTPFKRIEHALIIDRELSLENNELTPSFKLIPKRIEEMYQPYISSMLEGRYQDLPADAHVIALDTLPSKVDELESKTLSAEQQAIVNNIHYAVIGTGPVGRVLAAHLYKSGHQVSVLCHTEEAKQSLDHDPIVVTGKLNANEKINTIYTDLAELLLTKPDVILICTKNMDSELLLEQIKACEPDESVLFVSCQNGLDVEEQIVKHFGYGRALRMVLNLGCGMVDSQQVHVSFSMTNCLSKVEQVNTLLVEQIAKDLTSADFSTESSEDYRIAVFKKALLNSSLGSICALTRKTMQFVMQQPEMREMVKQIVVEGIAIAKAMDIAIEDSFADEAMSYLDKGGDHKPSILIDIEKGRKTENDYHCAKLAQYAVQYKVKVKVIPVISQLIQTLEKNV